MGGVYGSSKLAAARVAKFVSEVPRKLAAAVAPRIDERIRDQFANETDPYGKPLPPLAASTIKRKGGNSVILFREGALSAGSHARAVGGKVVITYGPAAEHAQDGDQGRGNRPPRMVAPAFGPPATWTADMRAAQAEVAKGRAK